MGIAVVERALDRFKEGQFTFECVRESKEATKHVAMYELVSTRFEGYVGFLKAEILGASGREEVYLTWSLTLAVVEDLRACPVLLLQNRGGLKNSSLYFSMVKHDESFLLIAEAQSSDRGISEDLIFWRIYNWYSDAPLMTTWSIPEGVTSIHPGYQARGSQD